MRSNIEVKPKHRQKSSRLPWKPTRCSRKYIAFISFRENFSKIKSFDLRVQDLHVQRKRKFLLHCIISISMRSNIKVKPKHRQKGEVWGEKFFWTCSSLCCTTFISASSLISTVVCDFCRTDWWNPRPTLWVVHYFHVSPYRNFLNFGCFPVSLMPRIAIFLLCLPQ